MSDTEYNCRDVDEILEAALSAVESGDFGAAHGRLEEALAFAPADPRIEIAQ